MPRKPLTLARAISTGRIRDFVRQQEAHEAEPADADAFEKLLTKTIKSPQSKRQTSRSPSAGGSRGK